VALAALVGIAIVTAGALPLISGASRHSDSSSSSSSSSLQSERKRLQTVSPASSPQDDSPE